MRKNRERGIALIMVLWAVAALSLLVGSFTANTRTQTNLARNIVETAQAEALADAGVHRMIYELAHSGEAPRVRTDGTPYLWSFNGGEVALFVQDERGKIDINTASEAVWRATFEAIGIGDDARDALIDAIVDFRDEDSDRLANGAEDSDYQDAGLDYGAKDEPFEVVDEFEAVLGISGPVYARVFPLLTVYSGGTQPVWEVAPTAVRALLAPLMEERGYNRRTGDNSEAEPLSPGDGSLPFEPLADANTDPAGGAAAPFGSVFTIHAEARTSSGAYFVRNAVIEVIAAANETFAIRDWRRGRRLLFPPDAERDGV